MPIFQQYTKEQKELLEFWFTANGLSYGKSLDSNGKYTYKTKNEIDPTASRRVEFRIVTSGEEVLENFVNKNAEYDGQWRTYLQIWKVEVLAKINGVSHW